LCHDRVERALMASLADRRIRLEVHGLDLTGAVNTAHEVGRALISGSVPNPRALSVLKQIALDRV